MKSTCNHRTIICFKRWSRKRFSVMASLAHIIKIGVLCVSYSLVNHIPAAFGQTDTSSGHIITHELEEVQITGRRTNVVTSPVSRMITTIRSEEIEKSGAQSIFDLLEFVSNIDIRQRGPAGVQSDASIRGSSFDHIMVMLNGIALNDPQTGHLALDLPIDPESIERIEILEGPAARVLGPGAFMGALNIITKNGESNGISAQQSMGSFNFSRTQFNMGLKTGSVNHFLSAGRSSSDGYSKNTDFKIYNLYYRGIFKKNETILDFQSGFQDKQFGAAGFYSARFPDQYEENSGWVTSLKVSAGNKIKITPHVYWRRRNDHFVLIRNNPGAYQNYHLTDVYGSQLNVSSEGKVFSASAGIDFRSENILSNNIGFDMPHPTPIRNTDSLVYSKQYQRTNFAVFTEFIVNLRKLNITTGFMLNMNTGFQNKASVFPGIDVSYKFSDRYTGYTTFNRALHLPTFTDLFYKDPMNQGNISLDANRMISGEGGVKFYGSRIMYKMALFYNSGKNMIDWLWSYSTNTYSPVNLSQYESYGFSGNMTTEYNLSERFPGRMVIHYTYLAISKSIPDSVSKYYNLKHKLSISAIQNLTPSVILALNVSYQDRFGEAIAFEKETGRFYGISYQPYWLFDSSIRWNFHSIELYAEINNLLNTRYIDAGTAIQPGRWFKAGAVVNLNFR